MKVTANVSPIAKAAETENKEDDFFLLRTWNRFRKQDKVMG